MASSYPGAPDSFTNPTASDTLDSVTVPHATQHANANDAIEAIEATLGTNPQGSSATVVARFVALDSTVASKVASSSVGVANGVASLDSTGKVPFAQIPSSSNAHASAGHATTAALAATYTAGTTDAGGGTGIGAKLTGTSNGRLNLDGLAVTTGDRVLVKNQTLAIQNGIYTVTAQGTGGTPFVLTRATDYNNSTAAQVEYGDYLLVVSGTVNALTSWIQNNTGTGTGNAIVIGTDNITFAQSAGTGVPVGGSSGQVLAKIDSTDYNTQWTTPASGTVTSITASSPLTGGTITSSGSIGLNQSLLAIANTQISGLGTASTKDVPASGNASSTQVVYGTDTRLSDSRTPTAHASTHGSAGSDPITVAQSQVTNLTTDLAAKAPLASPTFTGTVTIPAGASISGFATLASPALTGTPTVPTAAVDTNTTQAASTAYVVGQGYAKLASPTFTGTVTIPAGASISGFAPLASPALTGTPTVPTAAVDTNTTQAASTAYVVGQGYAKLASPTFTGTVTIPAGASISGYAALGAANAFTVGGHTITAEGATVKPLILKGAASQSANLQEWQDSSSTISARISSLGEFVTSTTVYANAVQNNTSYWSFNNNGVGQITARNVTNIPFTLKGAASQTADLLQLQSSAATVLGGRNALAQIYSGSTSTITSGVGGATTAATGTGTTATLTLTSASNAAVGDLITVAGVTPTGYNGTFVVTAVSNTSPFTVSYANATTAAQTVAGTVSLPAQASVTARSAGTKSLVVRGASGQSVNLQEWQNSSGNLIAYIDTAGNVLGNTLRTNSAFFRADEASSGATIQLKKLTAAAGLPGASDYAKLYFRDGTTAGTLKLVVRAGTAGAETTILDNIPQT